MLKSLRKWQIALENTPGTEQNALDRLLGEITFHDASETVTPEADYGFQDEVVEDPVLVLEATELSWNTDLSFEQILYPLLAGVRGGISPTEVNPGEGDYQWDFIPEPAQKPYVDSFTIEYIETDGGAVTEEWTVTNALCSELGISWEAGPNLVQMTSSWFATGMVNKAAAAGIAKPARTLIPAKKVTVYIGTSFADLVGGTPRTDVLSGDWSLTTGITRKDRADGDLGFSDYKADKRRAELTLTFDLGSYQEDTLRAAKFRTGDEVFVRIMVEGAQIGAGENKTIIVDGRYVIPEWNEFGDDDDNESIIEVGFVSQYDPVGNKAFSVHVINDQGDLPGELGS